MKAENFVASCSWRKFGSGARFAWQDLRSFKGIKINRSTLFWDGLSVLIETCHSNRLRSRYHQASMTDVLSLIGGLKTEHRREAKNGYW